MKKHVINCLGIMLLLIVSIILSSCEKKKSYYSSSYSSTSLTATESTLPKVAIMGCNLGDSPETVEEKLKEKGISGKKQQKETKTKILQFLFLECSSKDIPSDLTFGNLQVESLCYRFYNDKLYQMEIYFKDLNKDEYEEVLGAFKKKYKFPEDNSSYYGPDEFRDSISKGWDWRDVGSYKNEYDKFYSLCYKRSDGIYFFDDWHFGYFGNSKEHGLGVFDSKVGTEMIKYMKQKKAEGEKSKQDDLF